MLQTLERRRKYIGVILSDEHTLITQKELIRHPEESFVILINIQFQKWLGFPLILFQTSYIEEVKKLV